MTTTTDGRRTRNRNPYTPEEKRQLKEWHAKATTTRSTTPVGAPERKAAKRFVAKIQEKKDQGFSWRELAEPLGLKGRTVNAYIARHDPDPEREPSRPKYLNRSINDTHRTKTFFPCGIHRIGIDPAYKASKPGGPPRCATCEKEKRRKRYVERERARLIAERAAKREAKLKAEAAALARAEQIAAARRAEEAGDAG